MILSNLWEYPKAEEDLSRAMGPAMDLLAALESHAVPEQFRAIALREGDFPDLHQFCKASGLRLTLAGLRVAWYASPS